MRCDFCGLAIIKGTGVYDPVRGGNYHDDGCHPDERSLTATWHTPPRNINPGKK